MKGACLVIIGAREKRKKAAISDARAARTQSSSASNENKIKKKKKKKKKKTRTCTTHHACAHKTRRENRSAHAAHYKMEIKMFKISIRKKKMKEENQSAKRRGIIEKKKKKEKERKYESQEKPLNGISSLANACDGVTAAYRAYAAPTLSLRPRLLYTNVATATSPSSLGIIERARAYPISSSPALCRSISRTAQQRSSNIRIPPR